MHELGRAASTALITAAEYRSTTSHKNIDDAASSGPWADNWNVTTTICARRSGSCLSAYAKLSWDGPVYAKADDSSLFDGTYFRLQVRESQSGTVIYKIGSTRGLGDGELRLDWHNGGNSHRTHRFSASPAV